MAALPFCVSCGARNASDADFCENCGAALAGASAPSGQGYPQSSVPPARPRYGRLLLGVVAVLGIGALAYLKWVEPMMMHRYTPPSTPETRLMAFAVAGQTDSVKVLLGQGVGPNLLVEGWGLSPLMGAAQNNRAAAVQALLEGGADPNFKAPDGATALFYAVVFGNGDSKFDMTTALLAAGADPNAKTAAGESPRSIAESRGDSTLIAGFDAYNEAAGVSPP